MQGLVTIHRKEDSQPEKVEIYGKEGHEWNKSINPVPIFQSEAQGSRHKKAMATHMAFAGERGCIERLWGSAENITLI